MTENEMEKNAEDEMDAGMMHGCKVQGLGR